MNEEEAGDIVSALFASVIMFLFHVVGVDPERRPNGRDHATTLKSQLRTLMRMQMDARIIIIIIALVAKIIIERVRATSSPLSVAKSFVSNLIIVPQNCIKAAYAIAITTHTASKQTHARSWLRLNWRKRKHDA